MAIEYFDGFENGTTPNWNIGSNRMLPGSVGSGRGGGRALETTSSGFQVYCNLTPSAKKTVGAAIYNSMAANWAATGCCLFQLLSDGNSTAHLSLNMDSAGRLQLRRGPGSGTVLVVSSQIFALNGWHYIEMQATIHDTTGICIVKYDGVEIINYSGDTRNAGTLTDISAVCISTNSGSAADAPKYDDLYVTNGTDATATTGRADDGFLGDVKVELLLPNGNGASSQWLGSDANSTDNYLLVDEHPPNTTDYVGVTTNGQRDLWDLPTLAAADQQVFAVQSVFYCQKTDAGAASVIPLIRDAGGTVTADAAALPLSTTYGYVYSPIRTTKPGGGAWTVTDVNGLQVGVEKA